MPKRPLKTNDGRKRYFHMEISEDLHNKLTDLAYKKNATIKALVTNAIIELIKHHLQQL